MRSPGSSPRARGSGRSTRPRATPASRVSPSALPVRVDDIAAVADLAERERIDLTVVGPEGPLALGLVDLLEARGRPVFGPTRAAAALESSKAFAKTLFARERIPTARFGIFEDPGAARAFVKELGGRAVVKADGLAAGKGAIVCADLAEADRAIGDMLERRIFGDSGARVVVEEYLEGEEVSVFALTDGRTACLLASAQDHKAVLDDDRGPNTGGMGAYSPAPVLDPTLERQILETVIAPTIRAMAAEGRPYRGVLFAGLMLTAAGARVLEYNVRFGDPECQVLMLRLADDLLPLCQAVAEGRGLPPSLAWRPEAAACVVLASGGYPGAYSNRPPDRGDRAGGGSPRGHGLPRRHGPPRRPAHDRGRPGPRRDRARIRHPRGRGARLRGGEGDPLRRHALPARHRSAGPPSPRPTSRRRSAHLREPARAARRRHEPPGRGAHRGGGARPPGRRARRVPDRDLLRAGCPRARRRRRWPACSRPRAGRATSRCLCSSTPSRWWRGSRARCPTGRAG